MAVSQMNELFFTFNILLTKWRAAQREKIAFIVFVMNLTQEMIAYYVVAS